MKTPFLIGRMILGGFFIYNGIHHFTRHKQMSQYAAAKKVPAAEIAVAATGALLVSGGTSIVLGVKPKLGVAAILTFLLGVSPTIHDFWNAEDPNQRMADMINFSKNLALAGAALALTGLEEPWPASVPVARPTKLERIKRLAQRSYSWAA